MPLLLLVLFVSVLLYLWLSRRGTTLTRTCRWRADRTLGPDHYRCVACGAVTEGRPRHCLRLSTVGALPPPPAAPPPEYLDQYEKAREGEGEPETFRQIGR